MTERGHWLALAAALLVAAVLTLALVTGRTGDVVVTPVSARVAGETRLPVPAGTLTLRVTSGGTTSERTVALAAGEERELELCAD